jgi:6-phosphofructokinase 1
MSLPQPDALVVAKLGEGTFPSPLHQRGEHFVDDDHRVLTCADTAELQPFLDAGQAPPAFEPAGPRPQIFFDPERLTCGMVTCGGLCPGLNNVIRSIVLTLTYAYGVSCIIGFRYGYAGLASKNGFDPIRLTPEVVESIHEDGGSLLGASRGPQELGEGVTGHPHQADGSTKLLQRQAISSQKAGKIGSRM